MDSTSGTVDSPVRPLLVGGVCDSRVPLHRNAYRLAVFEIDVETLVCETDVSHAMLEVGIQRIMWVSRRCDFAVLDYNLLGW